jgi:HlyD family secretion protein
VDETDVGSVAVGQRAKAHIHAWPNKVFEGVVDTIALAQNIDQRSGTKYFETKILLASADEKILSGLTADVDIETNKHQGVLKVPSQAVLDRAVDELPMEIRSLPEVDQKKTYASVVYRYVGGKAVVTPVKFGKSDVTHTIILSGITEEDQIVTGPYKVLESIKHDQEVVDEKEKAKGK